MSNEIRQANDKLLALALSLPGAYEDNPWEERVAKVNKKIFVFFGLAAEQDNRLYVGVKLPSSRGYAESLPFVTPMGYNLGKHGWMSCQFKPGDEIPLDLLQEWVVESYRAVAPKKLVAQLAAQAADTL